MYRFFSLRRIVVVAALLGALALAGPLPAAIAEEFEATGIYAVIDHQGNVFTSNLSGESDLGGGFGGTASHKATGPRIVGTATFDYGGGDTLTFTFDATLDKATSIYDGTYLVTGGTGALANASGFGLFMVQQGTGGGFFLSGELDL
jgi:hypothetical protein